ncbi:alpha/beta hydrolase family esterase [candidate division KSB1 bacterium]
MIPELPGDYQLQLETDTISRSYLLHIPPGYDGARQLPVVLVFHGATGSGKRVAGVSDFSEVADSHTFITVYPDGIGGFWNDGREVKSEIDDVDFVSALIDHIAETLKVDSTRIYASGISNGAMMVFRLACELSEKIAAIAPVAGTLPENVALICVPTEKVPVIMFHGTEDAYLPYEGGSLNGRVPGVVLSAYRTAETWAKINECSLEPETTIFPVRDPTDGTQVQRDSYFGPQKEELVVVYTIYGGGHTWPSGRNSRLLNLGKTSREIKATDVIWEFFSKHQKKRA